MRKTNTMVMVIFSVRFLARLKTSSLDRRKRSAKDTMKEKELVTRPSKHKQHATQQDNDAQDIRYIPRKSLIVVPFWESKKTSEHALTFS